MVSFFGSFRTGAGGLTKIYFLKIDMGGIASGLTGSLLSNTGIYRIYQVGANGYCYGDYDGGEGHNVEIIRCETPTTPFYFSLLKILADSNTGSLLNSIRVPSTLTSYEHILRGVSYAVWVLLIIVACLSLIMAILGVFSAMSRGLSVCVFLISVLNTLCALAAAAAATGLYRVYRDKFNSTVNQFGAVASLGTAAFGLIWGMAGAALLSAILWSITMCCGSTRTKHRDHSIAEKREYDQTNTHY